MLKKWFLVAIIVLALVTGYINQFPSDACAQTENRFWAVIVDVVDYQYQEDRSGCRDGSDLYQQLQSIFGSDHIKFLTNAEATKTNVKQTILNWLDPLENAGDTVLFFFSGHGSRDYIAPYDATKTSYTTAIASTELAQWLDNLESKQVVVIINSCESGSFTKGLSRHGRIILTSSAESEDSRRSPSLGHSVFGHFVIESFSQLDKVDANKDHQISAEEIFKYVAPKVLEYGTKSGFVQHPQIGDGTPDELTLFTTATITFASTPAIAPINIDGKTYQPKQLPASFTWASGTTHTFTAPSSQVEDPKNRDTRYLFASWNGNGNSNERKITVSKSESYVANYKVQYRLNVVSNYAEAKGGGWYDANSEAIISVSSDVIDHGDGTRHRFLGWGSTPKTATGRIVMDSPKTVTASWQLQYKLTVTTDYGEVKGGGWYDANSEAVYSLSADVMDNGDGSRHGFIGWEAGGTTTSGSIIMDSPKVVTAKWQSQPISIPGPSLVNRQSEPVDEPGAAPVNQRTAYFLIPGVVVVLALTTFLIMARRRNEPAIVASPIAGAKLVLPDHNEISLAEAIRPIGRNDFDRAVSLEALKYISRQHLLIKSDNGKYFIEDCSSTNGTKTNGVDIKGKGRQELRDGDRIDIADLVTLTFRTCYLPQRT